MDLTPTPDTKRTRAKASPATPEAARKPTVTIKKPRTRKKEASAGEEQLPTIERRVELTNEQVLGMIATAAYYRAAERDFAPGGEVDDWLAAEQQVRAGLG